MQPYRSAEVCVGKADACFCVNPLSPGARSVMPRASKNHGIGGILERCLALSLCLAPEGLLSPLYPCFLFFPGGFPSQGPGVHPPAFRCAWGDGTRLWWQCFQSLSGPGRALLPIPRPAPSTRPTASPASASGASPVCHGTCSLQLCSPALEGCYGLGKAPPPRDRPVLVPEVPRCAPSHGKQDFADVATFRTLRWEYCPTLATWATLITRVPRRGQAAESATRGWRGGGAVPRQKQRRERRTGEGAVLLTWQPEEGVQSQGQRVTLEAGKGEDVGFPLRPPEEHRLHTPQF